jgi:hypothetical protein
MTMSAKRFRLPDGRPFEIPLEWWTEAGMDRFIRGADTYYLGRPQRNAIIVYLPDVDVPSMEHRELSLDRDRMISVLWAIVERAEICPVSVTKAESGNYRYRLHKGNHRFHASIVAGFTHIPALLVVR